MDRLSNRVAKLEASFAPDAPAEAHFLQEALVEALSRLRETSPRDYEHISETVRRESLPETVRFSELPSLVRDGLVSAEEGAALEALFLALSAEVAFHSLWNAS
jgi:hypothetical protein